MGVFWKVSRHPIEQHANASLVAPIDEVLEVLRRTVTAGRRIEPDHLVPPRPRERMLHHREQLDVREAHLLHIGNKIVRQFAKIVERGCPLLAHEPTNRGAPRRPTSAVRARRRAPAGSTSSPRPATHSGTRPEPPTLSAADSRRQTRTGRFSSASDRRSFGSRTCTSLHPPDSEQTVPRCPPA